MGRQTEKQYIANCSRKITLETKIKISKATKGHKWHTAEQIDAIKISNSNRKITDETREKWSNARLNNSPTKANYPPLDELIKMIESTSLNLVSKQLGITFSSLKKYLQRRNITTKDSRFKN